MSAKKIIIFLLLVICIGFAIPKSAFAQAPVPNESTSWVSSILEGEELIPAGCRQGRQDRGQCGVAEIFQTLINITRLFLGLMGSVALFMFVYGGLLFILSAGNQEKVNKAKNILVNTSIGIVVILTSWSIINFIILAITSGKEGVGKKATIFEKQDITKPPKNK